MVKKEPIAPSLEQLRALIRSRSEELLTYPNVNSVGIGYRVKGGKKTGELCLQFSVDSKMGPEQLETVGQAKIPATIEFDGVALPTDVVERRFRTSHQVVEVETKPERKRRVDPLCPGVSVGHPATSAGTLGAIVYDAQSGAPCILSNWHVLQTVNGHVGDAVVQPGPYDDNQVERNAAGVLLRSHLGLAGDCAVARIEGRGLDPSVLGLGVRVDRVAKPELGDRVVKSGRTSGVTYGVVRRVDMVTKMSYGGAFEDQHIGCFEIGPDPQQPPGPTSEAGDSGALWLIAGPDGKAQPIAVGLHFAGEAAGNPDEHALACYAHSVFQKLDLTLQPPAAAVSVAEAVPRGYAPSFLTVDVPLPEILVGNDVYRLNGSGWIPYTHFSVSLSLSRRLPRVVAWNIDGSEIKKYDRKGLEFQLDPRIDAQYQTGNDVYADNKLDRGHIARRADLVWGPAATAKAANRDSFYYTNITPQHQAFNQSERHGLWGLLENAIYEDVEVEALRVAVMGGPVFKADDMTYRGIRIPAAFWKAIFYREDGVLRGRAYVLTQDNLLNDIEALQLDPFRVYQISLDDLELRAKLRFDPALKAADTFAPQGATPQVVAAPGRAREIQTRADVVR